MIKDVYKDGNIFHIDEETKENHVHTDKHDDVMNCDRCTSMMDYYVDVERGK